MFLLLFLVDHCIKKRNNLYSTDSHDFLFLYKTYRSLDKTSYF